MFDILIIGSGISGLTSAIFSKKRDKSLKVAIVSKSNPTNSQSTMAQGGINASISDRDSIESHIEDTFKSSKNLADRKIVEILCKNAPESIKWLNSIGVAFSRDENRLAQRKMGGSSFGRTCYAQDYTGLKIVHSLYDEALKLGVEFLSEKFLLDLIVKESKVIGVELLNIENSEIEIILAKSTILASGGYSKIYGKYSTNSFEATGDGVAIAKRANCKISDMEFIQFHPTGLKSSSILISESARGEGGVLIDKDRKRFVDELATRDEVAREIFNKYKNGEDTFLDISKLDENFLKENLPQEIKLAQIYEGVDAFKEPIPIKPVAHYTIGGIDVDKHCKSSTDGLFAVGEVANIKVHGANRLGGNSLLDCVVFGQIVADEAVKFSKKQNFYNEKVESLNRNFIENLFSKKRDKNFYELKNELAEIMYSKVGIIRSEKSLLEAKSFIDSIDIDNLSISDKSKLYNSELVNFLEFKNSLSVASYVIDFALERKVSVGAHFRED